MSSPDIERLNQMFKNVKVAPSSRRGSDAGVAKTFHLVPGMNVTVTTTTTTSGRESPSRNCQMHFHAPPGASQERRGSSPNIVWRKTSHSSFIPAGVDLSRRGSTPGDVHLFPSSRRDSISGRKFSTDSIEMNEPMGSSASGTKSWNNSVGNIIEEENENSGGTTKPKFIPVTTLEDTQAIRCAEFHPRGNLYAVGSNSKVLRICGYPDMGKLSEHHTVKPPNVLYKRMKHHRGSIYCLGWSPDGNLLATGSNDKTVKLTRFEDLSRQEFNHTQEVELTMHDGTIRDVCFIEDLSNKSSLLVSGGAGDCKIYVTDCVTATPFQALTGHSAPILSLYNWGGVMFCSGSQDKSIRLWDLRTRGCVNMISPLTSSSSSTTKSPVGSVAVDPTGRLMVSGHEDSAIVLYDIRGNRQIQTFRPHDSDVRSVRFSPNAYYLLSAGYDQRLMLTDLQGDLSLNLASVPVASHEDKIISGRWHPTDFSFLSTSADKTVKLWGLPSE